MTTREQWEYGARLDGIEAERESKADPGIFAAPEDDRDTTPAEPLRSENSKAMVGSVLICDFCSAPAPAWRYPARTFLAYCVANVAGESVGDWAACDECHKLIEAGNGKGLAQRSLDELILKHPEAGPAAAVLYEDLVELHNQFFAHRSGTAVPITRRQPEREEGERQCR